MNGTIDPRRLGESRAAALTASLRENAPRFENPEHEEALLAHLRREGAARPSPRRTGMPLWLALNGVLCAGLALVALLWAPRQRQPPERPAAGASTGEAGFLASAAAAEARYLREPGVLHVAHTFKVLPLRGRAGTLAAEPFSVPLRWRDAAGKERVGHLRVVQRPEVTRTIVDEQWLEAETGRFIRVLREDGALVWASAFDGSHYETAQLGPTGIKRSSVAVDATAPRAPAPALSLLALFKDVETELKSASAEAPTTQVTASGPDEVEVALRKSPYYDEKAKATVERPESWFFTLSARDGLLDSVELVRASGRAVIIERRKEALTAFTWSLESQLRAGNQPAATEFVHSENDRLAPIPRPGETTTASCELDSQLGASLLSVRYGFVPQGGSELTGPLARVALYELAGGRYIALASLQSSLPKRREDAPAFESSSGFRVYMPVQGEALARLLLYSADWEQTPGAFAYVLESPQPYSCVLVVDGEHSSVDVVPLVEAVRVRHVQTDTD